MDESMIHKVVSLLRTEVSLFEGDSAFFPGLVSIPFTLDYFNSIPIRSSLVEVPVAFIDGGNIELITAPNFSLHIVRVYGVVYKEKKKTTGKTIEFFVLVQRSSTKFMTSFFPYRGEIPFHPGQFDFDINDATLQQSGRTVSPSFIGGVIRHYAELHLASFLLDKCEKGVVVLDGSLQENAPHDRELFQDLFKKAKFLEVRVVGVSKTSDMVTKQGSSVVGLLHYYGPKQSWFYYPIVTSSGFDVCFVKLHPSSRYVFRMDIFGEESLQDLFYLLASYSCDPAFLGYPYGMVEADQMARVSQIEKSYFATKLMAGAGASWTDLEKWLNASNAHSVLDRLQF